MVSYFIKSTIELFIRLKIDQDFLFISIEAEEQKVIQAFKVPGITHLQTRNTLIPRNREVIAF
jgi:hypothetical protein